MLYHQDAKEHQLDILFFLVNLGALGALVVKLFIFAFYHD